MNDLTIKERRHGSVTVLDLAGRINLGEGSASLRRSLRVLLEEGKKNILLNLEKVSYVDSSGLGELVASHVTVRKNGGELKLLNLSERVADLMMMTKLLTIFDIFEDEDEAVRSFEGSSPDLARESAQTGAI